jgi:hypothetical protein
LTLTEKYSRRLFFFTLIFSPLAFGTVEPWSYAVMELAAFAALFLYFIHTAKSNSPFYEVPGLAWLLSFLVFILLQAVPMPSFLVSLISPASYEIQQAALHAGDGGQWMTVSVHPRATVHAFFRYSTYAAFYLLTVQLLTRKELFKKTVFVITVFGAVLAFSSILQSYLRRQAFVVPPCCPFFNNCKRAICKPQSLCRVNGDDFSSGSGSVFFLPSQAWKRVAGKRYC